MIFTIQFTIYPFYFSLFQSTRFDVIMNKLINHTAFMESREFVIVFIFVYIS